MAAEATIANRAIYDKGQRFYCGQCGSEIEIVIPCTCNPPSLVLQCCGESMKPTIGRDINLGVE